MTECRMLSNIYLCESQDESSLKERCYNNAHLEKSCIEFYSNVIIQALVVNTASTNNTIILILDLI